jgi:hypothetical protein
MRATSRRLGNPAAEQAEGPPVDPTEMSPPDIACAVYRASQRPYRTLFESVWGAQAFAISWPTNTEDICNQPGRHLPMIRDRFTSARLIEAVPPPLSIRWRNRSPSTRRHTR